MVYILRKVLNLFSSCSYNRLKPGEKMWARIYLKTAKRLSTKGADQARNPDALALQKISNFDGVNGNLPGEKKLGASSAMGVR